MFFKNLFDFRQPVIGILKTGAQWCFKGDFKLSLVFFRHKFFTQLPEQGQGKVYNNNGDNNNTPSKIQ